MEKEKNKVAMLSVLAALVLTIFKFVVGILTGSLGILSEALHSGLDMVAAVITWFSVRISDKPADQNHHFGHGKVENFSAFIETILLLVTCVWIVFEAISRLVDKEMEIEVGIWSYVVVVTSIVIDISRSTALKRVAKKYNSQALEADALHFSTDIWSSSVVLFGLICANLGIYVADVIAALVVAVIVIYISIKLGKKSIDVLLDKAPQDVLQKIRAKLLRMEQVRHFKNLRVRSSGADIFVEVTIEVDPGLSIIQAHDIANETEIQIRELVSRCEVHVHAEPFDI